MTLEERFNRYVQRGEGCWAWTGAKTGGGYGSLAVTHSRSAQATHVAWYLAHGEWPAADLVVCHTCDNRACVNPAHLLIGTQKENLADMRAKGRERHAGAPGERNQNSKLTPDAVREIRRRRDAGEKLIDIGRSFGVTPYTVWGIAVRRSWRHVV